MKKKILVLGVIAIMIAMLIILTGCGNTDNNSEKTENKKVSSISIIDNMKNEAQEELENMYNFNSSGYIKQKAESVFDDEIQDKNMITRGVFKFVENGKTYYYFRGDVDNNYVKFGKNAEGKEMYWRILRTNADDTLRLLYYGTTPEYEDKSVGTTKWHSKTGYITDAKYSTSDVKTLVEKWYNENIVNTGYDEYVAEELFVSDNSVQTIKNDDYFGSSIRVRYNYFITDTAKPSLDEVDGAENLKLKVGIISADEALLAGANSVGANSESKPFIASQKVYWTSSPDHYYSPSPNKDNGTVYFIATSSSLTGINVDTVRSVVPVINLNKDALTKVTGNGTKDNPYIIN